MEIGQDLHNANLDLAKYRREVTRLKNELANRDKTSKLRPHAEEIFDFWNQHCRGGKARAFNGKRLKAVLDRLGEGKDEIEERKVELKEAILGAVTDAFKNPETGVPYDDLELICRDDVNVDRFRRAYKAREGDPAPPPDPRLSPVERGFLKLLEAGQNPFRYWPEANPVCVHPECRTMVTHHDWTCAEHQEWHIAFLNRCSDLIRLQEVA
jgi:hypothetical protein